jgi:2-methylisocitrate lyase-like PEP mutase family enzyme
MPSFRWNEGADRPGRELCTLCIIVAPKPVNVLMSADTGLKLSDLAQLGVRRVSVGSSLARVAWGGFIRAAKLMAEEGSFAGLDGAAPFGDLNQFFHEDLAQRLH